MKKMNEQLRANEAKAFAAHIEKLEKEIEAEETYDDGDIDWRVRRVGDVGSDSWNAHMQEIELELGKLRARHANSAKFKDLQRIKQLAGIANEKVEALATKQAIRQPKNL